MQVSPKSAIILTLLATLFWGANFQATKIALESLSSWTASSERFIVASLFIIIFATSRRQLSFKTLKKNIFPFIFLGTIGVAGFNGALFLGLQTSHPVTAALIMATTPISANILEAIIRRRAPQRIRVIGMAISLLGVSVVITNGNIFTGGSIALAPGDIIIFVGSLGWSIYTVGTRAMVVESTPIETTSWTMLFGTFILSAIACIQESPIKALGSASLSSHLADVYMGIAGSVLAYLFWIIGISTRGPGKTAIFFNFVPLFAIVIQAVLGSMPSSVQLLGAALTIAGVLLGQRKINTAGNINMESKKSSA
ncbi:MULTISPECIES: DMT family transporter [Dickeya]|uniref:Permease of the drug/metabolite transporter (DMT) superfamily n=1 Tax=Dickeya aquatica TaxID=1401087 RepID=A0A375AH15_9GAMM|nr:MULTISPECIES: DMT family transporter [Dickeya]SLM64929.1 Permease of the drug/metabolite transporter (DMT) superfamily [Dickeya aquatica]